VLSTVLELAESDGSQPDLNLTPGTDVQIDLGRPTNGPPATEQFSRSRYRILYVIAGVKLLVALLGMVLWLVTQRKSS
jgi:hypothetical protein